MADYKPVRLHRDGKSVVTRDAEHEVKLRFDGWVDKAPAAEKPKAPEEPKNK